MSKKYCMSYSFLAAMVFCFAGAQYSFGCGVDRWGVKVAQDTHNKYFYKNNDAGSGKLVKPQPTTIDTLQLEPYPFPNLKGKPPKWSYMQRAGAAEFRMWTIDAVLFKKKTEADEDYHLILKGANGVTMVAEIPSGNCVEKTPEPIKSLIVQARADFDQWFGAHHAKTFNQRVCLTGMGFFDDIHGAEGSSPNGIELHPVIKIEFLKKSGKCRAPAL